MGYLRGRFSSKYKFKTLSPAFRNQVLTSPTSKGRSFGPRSRFAILVISSAVLAFLILFKCSLHPFIETGIRVRRLAHLLLSRPKAELIKHAPVVICF